MAQTSYSSISANQTGTQYRTQDNDRYAAALSSHSGNSRPAYAVAGTEWLETDVTPWNLWFFDGTDDILLGTINATTNEFTPANAATAAQGTKADTAIQPDGSIAMTAGLVFEGATADPFETTLTVTDPTADRTITLPDASGTVLLADGDGSQLTGINGGTETITAGENIADRDAIYLDDGNLRGGGATKWYKIDTDASGPVKVGRTRGIALAAITSGNTGSAQIGPGEVTGLSGLTAGQAVYASGTAGIMTQTEPAVPSSGAQNAVCVLGWAISTTAIQFEPWHDVVFQARNSALAVDGTITVNHWTDGGAREREVQAYIATSAAPVIIDRTLGTNIGTMTAQGGLAAAFDGNTSQSITQGAAAASVGTTSYIGKDDGAALYAVTQAIVYASTDAGFQNNAGGVVTATIQVSTDNFSSSVIDLASNTGTDTNGTSITVSAPSNVTAYRYRRMKIVAPSGAINNKCAEAQFFVAGVSRDEPVTIGSATVDAAVTDKMAVKFSDASNANADNNTTFANRTGGTRDVIVEVVL